MANNDHGDTDQKPRQVYERHGSLANISYSPSIYIQNLLNVDDEHGEHGENEEHKVFCEMDVLTKHGEDLEWKEASRWVKYEEDVDEGGERWSKPHVASMTMNALFELRNLIQHGCVMLDVECTTMAQLADMILDRLVQQGKLNRFLRNEVREVLLKPHKHQHEKRSKEKQEVAKKHWSAAKHKMRAVRSIHDFSHQHRHSSLDDVREGEDVSRKPSKFDSTPNLSAMDKSASSERLPKVRSNASLESTESAYIGKPNTHFLRKLPAGAEVANIFVGEMEDLHKTIVVFVRLTQAHILGDLTEVDLPTRFLFIIMGAKGTLSRFTEIGRAMATMAVDDIFREVMYKAHDIQDITAGIDEFMEHVTVLPPGEWDPSIRLEPPAKVPSQMQRRTESLPNLEELDEKPDEEDSKGGERRRSSDESDKTLVVYEPHCDPTLTRYPCMFGGLIADIKRKIPWYPSDFIDSLHLQCIASFIFLYLATLTPNVTFGAVLGEKTEGYMAAMECILAAAITGVAFALFSGQPLNILGSTGPMLVLEQIVFQFCSDQGWDYMPYRVWIGIWTAAILMVVVAFDLSFLVKFITRFTEDCFATLIAVIFIYEAFVSLFKISKKNPLMSSLSHDKDDNKYEFEHPKNCNCTWLYKDYAFSDPMKDEMATDVNRTHWAFDYFGTTDNSSSITSSDVLGQNNTSFQNILFENNLFNLTKLKIYQKNGEWAEVLKGSQTAGEAGYRFSAQVDTYDKQILCDELSSTSNAHLTGCEYVYHPDILMFSIILFVATFVLALFLVKMKNFRFFPTWVRQVFSDFGVLIAIIVMVGVDIGMGMNTPKLLVPDTFEPTRADKRPWFIDPITPYTEGSSPWWLPLTAVIPGLLASILIFMDQQITAVIVNRSENLLKKGSGYHLDMFVLCFLIVACSILGLPWYVAATVSALAHIMSLEKTSLQNAPGEKPKFLGVREQRVTALLVGILSGITIFLTSVLKLIPMAVLYGVFFYMGIAALLNMQFVDRILILLMPPKYQPDYMYLRHVRLWRVHLFTGIQILCLTALMIIKQIKAASIVFPIMVLATCFVRWLMEFFFTQEELHWLDDIMPLKKNLKRNEEKKKSIYESVTIHVENHYEKPLPHSILHNSSRDDLRDKDEDKKPASFYVGDDHLDSTHDHMDTILEVTTLSNTDETKQNGELRQRNGEALRSNGDLKQDTNQLNATTHL